MGERLQQIDQVATFPVLEVQRQDQRTPVVKLTKAITHSVGADLSLLDFPKLCSNSAVRGHPSASRHTPTATNLPWSCGGKRWKTRDRTASQNAHQTGMGRRSIASQKPLKVCRSLSLGGMNLDVEGSGQHEAVGVRFPCTPGHDGGNQDEGLQRPACPVAATVLLGGVFDLFPDLRSDKLTHRTGERLGTLGEALCPFR